MAKTTFVNGTVVTPEFLNGINNPVFDGQDYDGHFPKITDDDLSTATGQIKPEWQAFRDTFKITAGTGLTINYQGGAVLLPSASSVVTVAPGTLSVPNNATSYIYLDSSGALATATSPPILSRVLAKVMTSAGAISSITDLRTFFGLSPRAEGIKFFGGLGDQGAKTCTNGETIASGEYYYSSFTVPAGVTVTISKFAKIYISGDCTIAGNVNVSQALKGGDGIATATFSVPIPGQGYGAAVYEPASAYSFGFSPVGSGGASGGGYFTTGGGTTAAGGDGGGGLIIECAGKITVSGTITANGGNAVIGSITGADVQLSGGGGGSGGCVWLKSLTNITVTGTISVIGGNGVNQIKTGAGASASGGGGGGGGHVILHCPSVTYGAGTFTLTGGTSGTGGSSTAGGAGGSFGGKGTRGQATALTGESGILTVLTSRPVV